MIACRFGDSSPAVARFAMDRGCVCYRDDREQDLCAQHIINAEPLGSMEVIEVYEPEVFEALARQ